MRLARLLAMVVLLAVVAGCGDDDESEETQAPARSQPAVAASTGGYVGQVTGTRAYVAISTDGKRASGTLCESRRRSIPLAAARVVDNAADLRSRGETVGNVTFTGRTAAGTIEVAGEERTFTLERTTPDPRSTPACPR